MATIGAHGQGSGHAHSGSLINAAASGAMSDVASGSPFGVASRPAMALVLAATLLFAPCDALSRCLARATPLLNCLGCVVPACAADGGVFRCAYGKRLLRSRRPLLQALCALMLVSVSFLVMFGRRRIPLAETTAIISFRPLLITAITALSAPRLRESAEKIQWAAPRWALPASC
ncbi:hypothetical protein [Dentiradicibacter hellwigii]|uniref:EamA domain-containing protein n=1 Tax=Dentiradicibacter hellwigii TaxID=3149053 RepID=A0ABV4UBX2_9RHOO